MLDHARLRPTHAAVAVLSLALFVAAVDDRTPFALGVPGRPNATPWVAAAGALVAVAWGATVDGRADVFVATSKNGGESFGPPVRVNSVLGEARLGGEFPPRVAVTPGGSGTRPEIAVLWVARGAGTEVKTSRSRDGGLSFDPPTTLQSAGALGDRGWPALALDPSGVAHAIWLDHRGLAARQAVQPDRTDHRSGAAHESPAQGSALYYASAGRLVGMEHAIADSVCYCCKTALAAGPDGTLFAAWRHVYPGNVRDIAMSVRRPSGAFSVPSRVSKDGWQINGCPDDGPSVAVDSVGTGHVVWPTVVAGKTPEAALFYASTRDGEHFTPRQRIPTLGGTRPSHPQVITTPTGRLVVAWDEDVAGVRVAAVRTMKPGAGGRLEFGESVRVTLDGAADHPVIAATDRGLLVVWSSSDDRTRVRGRMLRLD
jgi:hypothetical protein